MATTTGKKKTKVIEPSRMDTETSRKNKTVEAGRPRYVKGIFYFKRIVGNRQGERNLFCMGGEDCAWKKDENCFN